MSIPHFTEPTTTYFWQEFQSKGKATPAPWKYGYPAQLPDSRILMLPIRQIVGQPSEAVASLIVNQASLSVHDELGQLLAEVVRDFDPEVVIGLPTLGLTLAKVVAQCLGKGMSFHHRSISKSDRKFNGLIDRYVPLGYSQKFWYTDNLATEISSITSPSARKKLYLDPNQLSLVNGKRAIIIDDAVSSGKTMRASWDFLESEEVGCQVLGVGVVMKQGERWRTLLGERQLKVRWVFESPLLRAVEGGWDVRE
jgi:adenine/guanine phosphoribosyltransferase-like PRPP-binding protein